MCTGNFVVLKISLRTYQKRPQPLLILLSIYTLYIPRRADAAVHQMISPTHEVPLRCALGVYVCVDDASSNAGGRAIWPCPGAAQHVDEATFAESRIG